MAEIGNGIVYGAETLALELTLNGREVCADVTPDQNLLTVLRGALQTTGPKCGCGIGECGACTVIVDGQAVKSCTILAAQCQGSDILTVEGLAGLAAADVAAAAAAVRTKGGMADAAGDAQAQADAGLTAGFVGETGQATGGASGDPSDVHTGEMMGKLRRSLPLHPLQQAFIDCNAVQCGYCTAGFLMVAYAYTQGHESPGREEIREAISGNLCRCTGYVQIIDAIESYVKQKSAGFPEIFAKIEAEEKAAAEAAAKAAAGSTGGHAEPGGEADGGGSGGSGAGATDPPDGGIEEVTLTDADSEAPEAKGGAA